MKKRIGILLGVILAISALVAVFIIADGHNHTRTFSFQDTARLAEAVNYDDYEPNSIIPADKNSGDIAEKIEGDKDAPIIIYEYADYACSHCAEANAVVNKMLKDYDGKIALVFRGYLISYFRNNVIASSAATADSLRAAAVLPPHTAAADTADPAPPTAAADTADPALPAAARLIRSAAVRPAAV